jgi:hypothetical protein
MKYWVAGHLTGGLGNRLFQHAAAMGLAEKYQHEVVFSLPNMGPTNHGPFDNIFRLFPSTRIISEEEPCISIPEGQGNVFTFTPFQENRIAANLVVDGWRQSARYFPALGVHAAFEQAIPADRQASLLQKYGLVKNRESTAFLHIRLGDYKILPHHQINIGEYCVTASKLFEPNTRFLLFSDEAKENKAMLLDFGKALGFDVSVVEETDELDSLFLMSQCWKGAIVANSTFSWWGAYFARQRCPNPSSYKACYPVVWGAGLPPARDVIPPWGIPVS